MSQQDLEQSATQNKLSTMEQFDIKVEPETHNDDTPHVHNMQQTDTFLSCDKKLKNESMLHHEVFIKDDPDSDNKCSELIDDTQVMCASTSHSSDGVTIHIKEEPADDVGYDEPAPLLVTQLKDAMSQQDLEQNKLSTMEQLDIKVEPETHNDDTPHVHNMQQTDTFLICDKKIKYENMLHHEVFIKDDPDSDNKCSELIDDTQVMCTSTPQSSDGVTIYIKEEPAADVGFDEPAPLPQTASGLSILPVPLKVEVEDSVDRLEVSSLESVDKQPVIPSGLRTDDVCVSGNSDCTRTVSVKEHAKCTASGNTYQCDVCHKCFSCKTTWISHVHSHTKDKPYKCNTCSKAFTTSSSLRIHIRIHTGEKPYKCNLCDRSFTESCSLNCHIRTHTGEKPYKCNLCEQTFSHLSSLNYHTRTHNGEKPFKCNTCDKCFSRLSTLYTHIRTHSAEKPYKCNKCDMCYRQLSSLHRHTRSRHTGEKPYKCDMCDKSFSRPSCLHNHARTHTGEKPYKCDVCDKSFSLSSTLHNHIRTHSREKYKCDICNVVFTEVVTLKNHTLTHTQESHSH